MVVMSDSPAPFTKRDTAGGKFIPKADTADLPFTGDIDIDADIQRLVTERDKLRVEVERLRAAQSGIIEGWFDSDGQFVKERDELRAANNGLRGKFESACGLLERMQAHLDRTGLARLGDSYVDTVLPRLIAEHDELRAENERLRVVLVWAESERAHWDGRNADRYWQMNRVVMQLHSAFLVTE
jgi:regulator of replication initiation timing